MGLHSSSNLSWREIVSNESEFSCEVVRVAAIEKHPNADKLHIIRIEGRDGPMAYVLVTGDDYKVGDLTVFVGVDSLVPVDQPEWEYCKKRLDFKAGSSHYRIRRAKLRGVQTDGVLVNVARFSDKLGDNVAGRLGVLKYETAAEIHRSKLENSQKEKYFKPNNKWKRLIPDYSVLNLRKVSRLFTEGEIVEISEKIHGSNIRFGRIGSRLYVASHHVIKTDMRSAWSRFWSKVFHRTPASNHWYGSDIWTAWVNQNVDWKRLPDGLVFYGEIFGGNIQGSFNYGLDNHSVRVFDVWDVKTAGYLNYIQRYEQCADNGLDHVPSFITEFNWEQMVAEASRPSEFTSAHVKEGVVVKSLDGLRRGKYVSDAYKEAV